MFSIRDNCCQLIARRLTSTYLDRDLVNELLHLARLDLDSRSRSRHRWAVDIECTPLRISRLQPDVADVYVLG